MKPSQLFAIGLALALSTSFAIEGKAGVPDLEAWTFGSTATRVKDDSEWKVNIGAGFGTAPDYVGSDDYTIHALPVVDIEWRGAYFLSTQRGLGLNVVRNNTTNAGPRLTWSAGRDASDNSDLSGMGDLSSSIEMGLFFRHFSGPWRLAGDVKYGLNDDGHNGLVGHLDLAFGSRISDEASLIIGASTKFADETYMTSNYGVTSAQATSTRTAYSPTAGFEEFAGYASAVYDINSNLYLTLDGRFTILADQASASSLVKASEFMFVGTTVGYRF